MQLSLRALSRPLAMTPGSSEFQSKQSTERECRALSSVTPEASSGRCDGVRVCSGTVGVRGHSWEVEELIQVKS